MARENETVMGGPARPMPVTHWSEVLSAADRSDPLHAQALDRLVQGYWKPVYAYIRRAWHRDVEDAKDLTQAFFTRILEKDSLARLRPERGSFRAYLKTALKHFLINDQEAATRRLPPGGLVHLEPSRQDLEALAPRDPSESPDAAYDRRWFLGMLDAAVDDLKGRLSGEGKNAYFEVFRILVLEAADLSYRAVAERVGVRESDVRNYLHHCRLVFREILRRRIRETVDSDAEVERELGAFLSL